MRLGFDLDGVFAGFERGFAPLFPHLAMPVDSPDFPPVWHYPQHYGATPQEVTRAWDQIKTSERFWRDLPPLKSNTTAELRLLNELRRRGHDIYFVTHRVGKRAKEQTEQWLIDQGFYCPTVLMTGEKGLATLLLKLHAYIDDKPSNIEDVLNVGQCRRVYIMDRPYNQDPITGSIRVASVEEMITRELERDRSGLLSGEPALPANGGAHGQL
jgi:hypothetical protein